MRKLPYLYTSQSIATLTVDRLAVTSILPIDTYDVGSVCLKGPTATPVQPVGANPIKCRNLTRPEFNLHRQDLFVMGSS